MKPVRTPDDVQQLGTILGVWAHPDDESFLAAGIMAAAIQNGQRVVCVTATRGEAGVRDEKRWPVAELGEIRSAELEAALKELGVQEHYWLGYHDGHCSTTMEEPALARLKSLVAECKPTTILTFGPEGLTGHPDHCCVSGWAHKIADGATVYHAVQEAALYEKYLRAMDEQFDVYFNIDKPPLKVADECAIALELTPGLVDRKRTALLAMPSQYEGVLDILPAADLEAILGIECFVRASESSRAKSGI